MAAEPPLTSELLAKFGPHRSYPVGDRVSASVEPDRLVKTHCFFCGQQCGIQLKVRNNEVIGFEPWEDFPFNKGMLCPKGVRRYLQVSAMFANAPDQADPTLRPILYAKQISDTVLRRSSLMWTIIRPATLTDGPATGRISAAHSLPAGHIPRSDVAGVVLGCLLDPHTENVAFDVAAGPYPIQQALHTL